MSRQEIGETPVELTVQERDQHNNLTGGWYYASDSEIIEAARNLPGAETFDLGELIDRINYRWKLNSEGWVLVIPIEAVADARRTEEE